MCLHVLSSIGISVEDCGGDSTVTSSEYFFVLSVNDIVKCFNRVSRTETDCTGICFIEIPFAGICITEIDFGLCNVFGSDVKFLPAIEIAYLIPEQNN